MATFLPCPVSPGWGQGICNRWLRMSRAEPQDWYGRLQMTGQRSSGYCLCLQLLPLETAKLSQWTENYIGNSIRPLNWHLGDALSVIMMELLQICHRKSVRTKQLLSVPFCILFHFCINRESLRDTNPVEIRFLFFTNCCLSLNRVPWNFLFF